MPAQAHIFPPGFFLESRDHSYALELWDVIPRFVTDKTARAERKDSYKIFDFKDKRIFDCGSRPLALRTIIRPARIFFDGSGKSVQDCYAEPSTHEQRYIYPTSRERQVEMVVRYLAFQGRAVDLGQAVEIKLTLGEIRSELGKFKNYNCSEIFEALHVLSNSRVAVCFHDGSRYITVHDLRVFEFVTVENACPQIGRAHKDDSVVIRLSSLYVQSIEHDLFQRMNYRCYMSFRDEIARGIYTRMCLRNTGSGPGNRYGIYVDTVYEFCGYRFSKPGKMRARLIDACKALADEGVILMPEMQEDLFVDKDGRDYLKFTPSPKFSTEMRASNGICAEIAKNRQVKEKLGVSPLGAINFRSDSPGGLKN